MNPLFHKKSILIHKPPIMKKTILAAAGLIALLAIQSCNNTTKVEVKTPEQKVVQKERLLTSSYRVPLAIAQEDIQRYNNKCSELFGMVPIRAYTINAEDLMEVLGIPTTDPVIYKYNHVRAYMGLDTLNNFKLYLTPVEGANLTVVPKVAGTDVILKDKDGMSYVLDLNAPCPATCDTSSPLYYESSSKK